MDYLIDNMMKVYMSYPYRIRVFNNSPHGKGLTRLPNQVLFFIHYLMYNYEYLKTRYERRTIIIYTADCLLPWFWPKLCMFQLKWEIKISYLHTVVLPIGSHALTKGTQQLPLAFYFVLAVMLSYKKYIYKIRKIYGSLGFVGF